MAFSYYNILTFTRDAKRKVSLSRGNLSHQYRKNGTSDETLKKNNLDAEQSLQHEDWNATNENAKWEQKAKGKWAKRVQIETAPASSDSGRK